MIAYGFYFNQAMAHKSAARYNRSHKASHNVISECISSSEIVCLYFKQRSLIPYHRCPESKTLATTLVN